MVIAGIGNLGRALARSQGFAARNFDVTALLDTDPAIIGERVDGVVVRHPDDLPRIAAERPLAIGVITTPASVAQRVADMMVGAGVRSILNFAPRVLEVPPDVLLRYVDLSIELQVMSFYQSRLDGRRRRRPDAGHPVDRPEQPARRSEPPTPAAAAAAVTGGIGGHGGRDCWGTVGHGAGPSDPTYGLRAGRVAP